MVSASRTRKKKYQIFKANRTTSILHKWKTVTFTQFQSLIQTHKVYIKKF